MKRQFKKAKISIKSVLCVSILVFGISTFSNMSVNATTASYDPPSYSSLIPHAPIGITFDSDFEVYPGAGTEEDPYVIEGYNITTTSTSGIYITLTTKHFIVRNCYVDAENYGIYINDVADGTAIIENNTCNANTYYYGIYIQDSDSSTITNNTCSYTGNGIRLEDSGNSTVANNTCTNNDSGITLRYSGSSTVANNTCNNNEYGITLSSSGNSTVTNNTCNNNYYHGIGLKSSVNYTATNNTCNNNYYNGIWVINAYSSTVTNNTCIYNHWGIFFSMSSGNSTVANNTCSYNNDYSIILEDSGNSIVANNTCNNNDNSIYLSSSGNSTVVNNTCNYNNNNGIYLSSSGNSTVTNNTNDNNNASGIFLDSSRGSTVANNTCNNNNLYGIDLSFSDGSTVANNTCNNNAYGIKLEASNSSTVANNTCSYNNIDGIYLDSSDSSIVANNTCSYNNASGIGLESADSSIVANNTCNNNYRYGIVLNFPDFCVVTYNLLQENGEFGIYLQSYSDGNLIHHNKFVDNNLGGASQACDDGNNNAWYDTETLEGNYWSDWSGTGTYSIEGDAGAFDLYPLDESIEIDPPLITNIIHSPSTPTELDTVSVNATVTDASGVQSVILHFRFNSGTWLTISMTLISSDLYGGTIGPFPVDCTIEYYVTAIDNSINHNEAIENNYGNYYNIFVGSSDVIGPSITGITHSPSTPTELDTVSISATVTDASGVQSVTLHYRVNGGTWIEVSMTLMSGNLYSGTIGSFTASDTIEYHITAVDNSVNHNLAINDNSGAYYSFTIISYEDETMIVTFSLLLPAITLLFFVFGLVVQQRRKSE